jgi:hypothetical protein
MTMTSYFPMVDALTSREREITSLASVELPSCKWRECGLPSQREKRHAPAAMTLQRIKCRSYLLLPQPLPQPLSKLLPFPAILFVRPPSVRISLGGGIPPRISGTVLVTVPRGNNHLSRRDVPEN